MRSGDSTRLASKFQSQPQATATPLGLSHILMNKCPLGILGRGRGRGRKLLLGRTHILDILILWLSGDNCTQQPPVTMMTQNALSISQSPTELDDCIDSGEQHS